MTTVRDIEQFLYAWAPQETAESWDNVGLLVGRPDREVRRVLKPGGIFLLCNECGGEDPRDEKWTEKIPGMTIYTPEELRGFLQQAGFQDIQVHQNGKGWLCVTARKGEA